jgi:microsomal dipeptidase-like Zn-dependent dipeptidase
MSQLKELPALLRRHFSRAQVEGIMGGNWLDFLERSLPLPVQGRGSGRGA